MTVKELSITAPNGLDVKAASVFVREAMRYCSRIYVIIDDKEYNAKSILGIMAAAITKGMKIEIHANGSDESAAISALSKIVKNDFEPI